MQEDLKNIGKFIIVSGVSSLCTAGFIKAAQMVIFKTGDITDITVSDIISK